MIEILMYIALGFVSAALIALLLAPSFWRRAVRLTRREFEATMPFSVSDIKADKDLLRAEYAVEMRRLELALDKASQRAARHLMERNRHMVEMGKLESEIANLKNAAKLRNNEESVMEQTVRKRLPELEEEVSEAQSVILAREQELAERARAFENQTEALEIAQSLIKRQEQEIDWLRQSLETGQTPLTARWGKSVEPNEAITQLSLENGELHAELSRLRERIGQLEEVELKAADELRSEMHRLANAMVGGAKRTTTQPQKQGSQALAKQTQTDAKTETMADNKAMEAAKNGSQQDAKPKRKKKRRTLAERISSLKDQPIEEKDKSVEETV